MKLNSRIVAFSLALAAATALWTVPIYSGSKTTYWNDSGKTVREDVHGRLIDANSLKMVVLVTILPLVVAFLPIILPEAKKFATAALLSFSVIGAMSVGLFYLPAAIAMFWPEPSSPG